MTPQSATTAPATIPAFAESTLDLRMLASGLAVDAERTLERTHPHLQARVRGYYGAHTGRMWLVAVYDDRGVLRTTRADLSSAELRTLGIVDVAQLAGSRLLAQLPSGA